MSPSAAAPPPAAEPPPAGSPTVDQDEARPITTRQVLRWMTVIGALVVAVLACWQDPSYATCAAR
ncbi:MULTISPECIES: hypothetical protein [unclassified Solwaraspora]|uniref:hypothetical protein n=1 Tax=unclassified Solwaraspora TaxID=2627926 RepID=UPI00248B4BC9|nr:MULTISPECIES: hypothetical protein [unclassified Solwaraspora]WBB99116.1 hypothetical protein O7553_09595 [Solwaraspora sp. WMMA2059]WBC22331.1 hypothetical protein O7543_07770 [Solwaraspora sp. WMMA2080]WJK35619.1 hypothetical protein O7610_04355 [Solwaraspora sp. WMMA2065]